MMRPLRPAGFAAVALAVLTAAPFTALAQGSHAASTCTPPKTHTLPKSTGGVAPKVISFGVQGGSLRPWSVQLTLDGSVKTAGTAASRQQLPDATHALQGVLALADAEGFFSLKKTVGCVGSAGNPDTSTRFISIHTSTGTKRVNELGSCAATSKFDQVYAVLEGMAGVGG